MDTAAVLEQLKELGVGVEVDGGDIYLEPFSAVPAPLLEAVRTHKPAILALLQGADVAARRLDARDRLLAWASELAEQNLVLAAPVSFIEAPLRPVTTKRTSWYAAHYLRTITSARIGQETGGWGMCDAVWWRQREQEAIAALVALRDAVGAQQDVGGH